VPAEELSFPEDLRFSKEHLWARLEDGGVRIGISEYMVDKLGRAIEVELPEIGQEVDASVEMGHVTGSGWGSFDLFSPLAGKVSMVNETLFEEPESVCTDPYDEGWLCILKEVDEEEYEALFGPDEYQTQLDFDEE
jgi:glycine cleavage system H protein